MLSIGGCCAWSTSSLFELNRLDAFMHILHNCHGSWASVSLCSWDKMVQKSEGICAGLCNVRVWRRERGAGEQRSIGWKMESFCQLSSWSREKRSEPRSSPFEIFSLSWQLKEETPLHLEWNRRTILDSSHFVSPSHLLHILGFEIVEVRRKAQCCQTAA